MITFTSGDILQAHPDRAVVVPVNTEGIAGAGLALQVKKADPQWFKAYRAWAKEERRFGGSVGVVNTRQRTWVLAATKEGTWDHSRIEWVVQCIWRLCKLPMSLAIPRLGCGLGGLPWFAVRAQLVSYEETRPGAEWLVYE